MSSTIPSDIRDPCSGFVDVGVDLAKICYQVAYADPSTNRMVHRQMTRTKSTTSSATPKGSASASRSRPAAAATTGAASPWPQGNHDPSVGDLVLRTGQQGRCERRQSHMAAHALSGYPHRVRAQRGQPDARVPAQVQEKADHRKDKDAELDSGATLQIG